MTTASGYHRLLATLGFFTLAAGEFWRYLVSWWGWGAIVATLFVLVVIELVRMRVDVRRLPPTLLMFLLVTILSIAWSAYPGASALGAGAALATAAFAVFAVLSHNWRELLDALSTAMRWVLGLSLLFEFVVAVFVRQKVLPLWVDYSDLDRVPNAFYWSRNMLFEGGRIQGILGNANLLAMVALIGLIAFGVRFAAARGSRAWNAVWIAAALATLVLTRSSTVIIAGVGVALAVGVVVAVRAARGRTRLAIQLGALIGVTAAAGAAVVFRRPLLDLLGRSPDLTNRIDIWESVTALVVERPLVGWGWAGYWPPWTEPFRDLAVINGVAYLQAHNAWLDVALQLGVLGLLVFGALVVGTGVRSWLLAIEPGPPAAGPEDRAPIAWAAAPLLLLVALVIQSLAESRLLTEFGFALLVVLAIHTARREERP